MLLIWWCDDDVMMDIVVLDCLISLFKEVSVLVYLVIILCYVMFLLVKCLVGVDYIYLIVYGWVYCNNVCGCDECVEFIDVCFVDFNCEEVIEVLCLM